MSFFQSNYGVDTLIPIYKNEVCEDWKKKVEDKYILKYEEVQILVMMPIKNQNNSEVIKVFDMDGKLKDLAGKQTSLFSNTTPKPPVLNLKVPPLPTNSVIPKPPTVGAVPVPPSSLSKIEPIEEEWTCPVDGMIN